MFNTTIRSVRLINITPGIENLILRKSRLISPNHESETLKWCIRNGKMNIFENGNLDVCITKVTCQYSNKYNDLVDKNWFRYSQDNIFNDHFSLYHNTLNKGIPMDKQKFDVNMNIIKNIFVNGNLYNWIHFIHLREGCDVNTELSQIANEIKNIFVVQLPVISKTFDWYVQASNFSNQKN